MNRLGSFLTEFIFFQFVFSSLPSTTSDTESASPRGEWRMAPGDSECRGWSLPRRHPVRLAGPRGDSEQGLTGQCLPLQPATWFLRSSFFWLEYSDGDFLAIPLNHVVLENVKCLEKKEKTSVSIKCSWNFPQHICKCYLEQTMWG